jgi:molecular chaperone DnaK
VAKRSLAQQPRVPVLVAVEGQQIVEEIVREEFDAQVRELLGPSLAAVDQALADADKTYGQVDRLVLVGGPSRMPIVQTMVADHTGLRPVADIDPELVVATGAALYHGAEVAKRNPSAAQSRFLPNFKIAEVTAHDVGCATLDRSGPVNRTVLTPVIRKNAPIPCRATETFALADPGQTGADVQILQGVEGADIQHCLTIGVVRLENLPPENGISNRIEIEYQLDANGMVTVIATDTLSGQHAKTSVDYKHDHAV